MPVCGSTLLKIGFYGSFAYFVFVKYKKNNNKVKLMWNDFFLELSNEGCLLLLLFTVLVYEETVKGSL